jgi:hypothetical protein
MPTTAETLLTSGFASLVAVHGEAMTWRSGSGIIRTAHGEAVTTEGSKALETGDGAEIDFDGIFDSEYALELPGGAGTVTTVIAASVESSTLPSAARGDIIERGGVIYYVLDVQPDGVGRTVLILSKHAH